MPLTSSSLDFEITYQNQEQSRERIVQGLHEANVRHLGEYQWTDLDVYVRNGEGQIVAGLIGEFLFGWLSIHTLWVAEELRGLRIGTQVLKMAEQAALQKGCHSALLDTLSFQAVAFYKKTVTHESGKWTTFR